MAQAKPKSNSTITTQWAGNLLSINILGAGEILFDRDKTSEVLRLQAELHGWTQRLCDRAAKPAPTRAAGLSEEQWKTQLRAHTQAKFDAVKELAEHYMTGTEQWKLNSTGPREAGMFLEAFAAAFGKTLDKAREFLATRTEEQLKTIRLIPKVVEEMNRLRLDRAGVAEEAVEDALTGLED